MMSPQCRKVTSSSAAFRRLVRPESPNSPAASSLTSEEARWVRASAIEPFFHVSNYGSAGILVSLHLSRARFYRVGTNHV